MDIAVFVFALLTLLSGLVGAWRVVQNGGTYKFDMFGFVLVILVIIQFFLTR